MLPMIENHATTTLAIENLTKALSISSCNASSQSTSHTTPNVAHTGTALSPNKKRKRDPSRSRADHELHARKRKSAGAPHSPLSMSMSQPFEVCQDTHPSADSASFQSTLMLAPNSVAKNSDAKSQQLSPSRDPTNSQLPYRSVLVPILTPSLLRASGSQTRQQSIQNETTNRQNQNINETGIKRSTSSHQQSANPRLRPDHLSASFANAPKSHPPSRVDLENDVMGTASSYKQVGGDCSGSSGARSQYCATTTRREESKNLPPAPVLASTSTHISPIRRSVTPLDSSRPLDNVEATRAPVGYVKTSRVSRTTFSPYLLYITIIP